jgi:CheY-like chemotaxis protein
MRKKRIANPHDS